jgi:hypothetical protein
MNGYTYIAVTGQNNIALNAASNTLNVAGTGGVTITTDTATNTLNFNISNNITYPDLIVTNSLTLNPSTPGTLNNISIGATTPRAATFTTLTTTGAVNLNPVNYNVTISPTGSGTIVINPAVTGYIDNMTIGATTPQSGTFTNILLTTPQPANPSSAVTRGYVIGLSAAYGVALS